jgi:AcrR family transcriptional regulator
VTADELIDPTDRTPVAGMSRQLRKALTRQALLDAALAQLENHSFGAISLREVAKQAGITPTAFYRHFSSMEELGIVLVDESFSSLRAMMSEARAQITEPWADINTSTVTLVRHVREHLRHYRFIARERSGGIQVLRKGIRHEIEVFSYDLTQDLAGYPVLRDLPRETLAVVARLIVTVMVATVERLLDAPDDADDEIQRETETQMRLIVMGAAQWVTR